jgi:hypothetical protein
MYPQSPYGPIGSVGVGGVSRGNMRYGKWRLPGQTGPHELRLDSGRLGFGPMHAYLDGWPVLQFPKPNRKQPVVVSPQGLIDGYEVVIYAESRDNGNSILVDVFVGGRSLLTGEPLPVVAARAPAAAAASSEQERLGCLLQTSRMAWFPAVFAIARSLPDLRGTPNGGPALLLMVVLAAATVAPIAIVLDRLLKRPGLSKWQAIAAALVAYVLLLAGSMLVLVVGLVVAGYAPGR